MIYDELLKKYLDKGNESPEYIINAGSPKRLKEFIAANKNSGIPDKDMFLLPWYSYSEEREESKGPFYVTISSPGNDKRFPGVEFIQELAGKTGVVLIKGKGADYPLSVFFNNKESWKKYLLRVLEIICFTSSGLHVRNMDSIFWESVLRCMGDYEKTRQYLEERRDRFSPSPSRGLINKVIEKLDSCPECGCAEFRDVSGISVGSPLTEIKHQILKECVNCGTLKRISFTEDRKNKKER